MVVGKSEVGTWLNDTGHETALPGQQGGPDGLCGCSAAMGPCLLVIRYGLGAPNLGNILPRGFYLVPAVLAGNGLGVAIFPLRLVFT